MTFQWCQRQFHTDADPFICRKLLQQPAGSCKCFRISYGYEKESDWAIKPKLDQSCVACVCFDAVNWLPHCNGGTLQRENDACFSACDAVFARVGNWWGVCCELEIESFSWSIARQRQLSQTYRIAYRQNTTMTLKLEIKKRSNRLTTSIGRLIIESVGASILWWRVQKLVHWNCWLLVENIDDTTFVTPNKNWNSI